MKAFAPRARAVWLAVSMWLMVLSGCAQPQLFHQEAYVFGTRVDLTIYDGTREQAEAAMGAVLREFDRLHVRFHAWEPSELTALNEAIRRGEAFAASDEMVERVRDAQEIAAQGGYLFDPAIGQLIALWGFHDDEFEPRLPDSGELERLISARPSISDLRIDGNLISSINPEVQLDFGGYAKGYALDRAVPILRGHGVENALINIGGNVMAMGSKGSQPWRLAIQHPREPRPLAILPLHDGEAIGTSGDYQRFFEIDGERFSHLLDPRSGRPAAGTQAVTVLITPRTHAGTLSDAASKPAFIAGDDWRALTRRYAIDHALRVSAEGEIEITRALRARLQIPSDVGPVRLID